MEWTVWSPSGRRLVLMVPGGLVLDPPLGTLAGSSCGAPTLPLRLIPPLPVLRMRAKRANPQQADELSTRWKCHNAVDSP